MPYLFADDAAIKIYELFNLSKRCSRELLLILPKPSNTFVYRMSSLWNLVKKLMLVEDVSVTVSSLKVKLRNLLLEKQKLGDNSNWIEHNFLNP